MKLWLIMFHGVCLPGVGVVAAETPEEAREALMKNLPWCAGNILKGEITPLQVPELTTVLYRYDGDY